mgnify:CR=1 FL=1
MDDDIFNPRKRLLTDKETVELVEIIEAAINKVSSSNTNDDTDLVSVLSE